MAIFDGLNLLIMNVYLTNTPEFSNEKLDEIIALLQGIPGELKFDKKDSFTQSQYKWLNPRFQDIEEIDSLTFKEYFDLVQGYREFQKDIKDEDFVILISSIRHDGNWFSAFSHRNIFVHGHEWDIISNVDSKFGIAYQCVENIFQSLIDLDIMHINDEPNIHHEPIGCINDLCGYKPEILKKLRMADICDSCYARSQSKGVSDFIITQILDILEVIRKEFVLSGRFKRKHPLEQIKIYPNGKIDIGGKNIVLNILPKVLYICLLKNLDGIPSDEVCENKDLFEQIYLKLKKNPDELAIQRMCCKKMKGDKHTPTFAIYKRRINEELIKKLGTTIANYYFVTLVEDKNHQNLYRVNLPEDKLVLSCIIKRNYIYLLKNQQIYETS